MRNWEMLYQRQPLQLDIMLMLFALILHAPLLFLEIKAPPKLSKDKPFSKLVNIDFIEQQIEKRKAKAVALPPKVIDVKDIMRKALEAKKKLKRTFAPPVVPKKKLPDTIMTQNKLSKLQAKLARNKVDPNKAVLKGKNGFKDHTLPSMEPKVNDKIKMGGVSAALQNRQRSAVNGPAVATLKSKSGFQVAKDDMPISIGGGDGTGIKMASASQVVVMPVGKRAKADSSILSPVVQDRGKLKSTSGSGLSSPSASQGLSMGGQRGGGASQIGVGKRGPRTPVASTPSETHTKKSFASKPKSKPLGGAVQKSAGSLLPSVPVVRRRRTVKKRPMFKITGPLANRKVLFRKIPEYPEWARAKGIEASVTLQFTVTPEGLVKNNILIARTSGYPSLDKLAVDSLVQWKFIALPEDQYRDEVGNITMRFSVR